MVIPFWNNKKKQTNPTKQPRRTPTTHFAEDIQCNYEVTYGIYHNQYPGTKLAGSLAAAPINIPVWLMGLPSVICEDKNTQERISKLIEDMSLKMQNIHMQCHRDGTIWVYPFYDSRNKQLVWEAFNDDTVSSIIKDLTTGEIVEMTTTEMINVQTSDSNISSAKRVRHFTKTRVEETITGMQIPNSGNRINVAGILPIPFSNNPDLNEKRGHSDYERIIYDLKNYHDIELARSTMLAKFNPKMIQTLGANSADPKRWLRNNGYRTIDDIDLAGMDFVMNLEGDTTSFAFPDTANNTYSETLKQIFKKIVEGSGVPEIAWGLKTEGNNASVEESMTTLLNLVSDKRAQKTKKYEDLFKASLRILSVADMANYSQEIKVKWGTLDGLNAQTKAEVFTKFATGVAALINSAGATKEQLYKLWQAMYPEETPEKFEEYQEGISIMGKHKAFKDAQYLDIQSSGDPDPLDLE